MFLFLKPAFNIFKKTILVIAVFFIVITLFFHFIGKDKASLGSSQSDPIKKNRAEIYQVINDKELNKTQQGKLAVAVYKISACAMIGEACTNNPDDAKKNYGKSIFGFITKLIVMPFANPPASGIAWVSDGLKQAGFIPQTMAAEGMGFAAIKPFANLWKIFRDVSYMLLVIVLIAIGFMIMFRAKINPQTIISVENALPKIVISLILITFSFAIAGFLIDLMYASIILIISILSSNNNYFNATDYQNEFLGASAFHIFKDVAGRSSLGSIVPIIGDSILGIIDPTIVFGLRSLVGIITAIISNNNLFNVPIISISKGLNGLQLFGTGLGESPAMILAPFVAVLFLTILFYLGTTLVFTLLWWLLIGGTVLFVAFRIMFLLFGSFLRLVIFIILGPILLLFEAIPGKDVFSFWIKNIIGYLLPFPITVAISLIGYIIINSTMPTGYSDVRLPYMWGIDSNAFKILVGMGLIFIIPDLVKVLKETLGIKEPPPLISLGTFFGGATAAVGGATGLAGSFGSWSLALGAFTDSGILGKTKAGEKVRGFLGLNKGGGTGGDTGDPTPVPK